MSSWLRAKVIVEVAASYAHLGDEILEGRADLAWAPPLLCARVRHRAAALLTVVRYGATSCRSALVVRADGGLGAVADLIGTRAAWVDPLSTSGHLMAIVHLRDVGLQPRSVFREERFLGSYRNALAEVVEGRADVTSVFVVDEDEGATIRELQDLLGPAASALAVLATTRPAPYDGLAVGPSVRQPEALVERLLMLDKGMSPPAMLLEMCRADFFVRANVDDYALFDAFVQT
jgi:phosphonate transport system substrate-binding protein